MATNKWCDNQEDVFRLATIVLADEQPTAEAAYLYGHTPHNEISALEAGVELYRNGKAHLLILLGGGPHYPLGSTACAYSGGYAWERWLVDHGVRKNFILHISRPDLSHTGTEAARLVKTAKEMGWRDIYIVSNPLHMLRAFANIVAQVTKHYPELRVWCKAGTPLPWYKSGTSSQGVVVKNRIDEMIVFEWDRLDRVYGNELDVASAEECLEYLKTRHGK